MFANAPSAVESVLLYKKLKLIDSKTIHKHVNFCLESAKIHFDLVETSDDASFTMMTGNGLHIIISQTPEPLSHEGFASALASPYTLMTLENLEKTIASHKARVFITVGSGMADQDFSDMEDVPEEFRKILTQDQPSQTKQEFETKLTICQVLTNYFFNNSQPDAVHWCQSDQLFNPARYKLLMSNPFPIPLFVHPGLFSSRKEINGTQVVGLHTFGASHLIGQEITFNEAPVPLSWMYERVCNFIEMSRTAGRLIPSGETFGANSKEIIRVLHRPASKDAPQGEIELTLEASGTFNLVQKPELEEKPAAAKVAKEKKPPSRQPIIKPKDPNIEFDVDDPMDRAIMERLQQTQKEARKASQTTVEAEPVPHKPQKPSFGRRDKLN
jgi:hypothetical protein